MKYLKLSWLFSVILISLVTFNLQAKVTAKKATGMPKIIKKASPKLSKPRPDDYYKPAKINTEVGQFEIEFIILPKDKFTMITDTADSIDCADNCAAKPLADYVKENQALVGIHGAYFCPPDYSQCAGKINSYNAPVYNSRLKTLINPKKRKFHEGPILSQSNNGEMAFYHRSKELKDFSEVFSAIANNPSLVEYGLVVANQEPLDEKQATVKSFRGGIGYNDQSIFVVIAKAATVPDLAHIFKSLGANFALNLDGGGSSALYYKGKYLTGPGRKLPSAVVFKPK